MFTFLLKVGGDDGPARLLPDLVRDLLGLIALVHVVLLRLIHVCQVILLILESENTSFKQFNLYLIQNITGCLAAAKN